MSAQDDLLPTVPIHRNLYLFVDRAWIAPVLAALSRQFDISPPEIAARIEDHRDDQGPGSAPGPDIPAVAIEDIYGSVAAHDLIIVAGDDIERRLAVLFNLGFHNVYNGNALVRRGSAAERFASAASGLFVGPVPPVEHDPGAASALAFSCERIRAGEVPRHKLFIVNSMPKSGTLWMVGMLAKILGVEARKQIIVSHVADLEVDWPKFNNHGAVVLVRDLRDVVVSWFHDAARADLRLGFREPRYPTLDSFYWEYFVGTMATSERYYRGDLCHWINTACANYVPLVRYEDMHADVMACLRKVLNAWQVDYDVATAFRVCEEFSFRRQTAISQPGDDYVSKMFRSGHLRRGAVGGWRTELPLEISTDIERRFAGYQKQLGYASGDVPGALA